MSLQADEPTKVNFCSDDSGGNHVLYVCDIPLSEEYDIYGQESGGGDGFNEAVINKLSEANEQSVEKGLQISRDNEKGIILSFPKSEEVKKIGFVLLKAKKDGANKWVPIDADPLQVEWTFDKAAAYEQNNNTAGDADPGNSGSEETDSEETLTDDGPGMRLIDWILIAAIIVLAIMIFSVMKKVSAPQVDKFAAERNKIKSDIATLQQSINELRASIAANKEAVNGVNQQFSLLRGAVQRLQDKENKIDRPMTNQRPAPPQPQQPSAPQNLATASPESGENRTLAINSSGNGFFQLFRDVDGVIKYTLVQNPEVINLFETNAGMLKIFKDDGFITFDDVRPNSHVRVAAPGITREAGNGRFVITSPLNLSFD